MQLFFAATLLVSATLLFIVEPMFAKKVLPMLGGSPSVWNTCLVFYQAALLAGYVYAHLSLKWLGTRRQAALHVGLLCLPWLVLALPTSVPPLSVPPGWTPPGENNPIPWLWLLLTVRLGLPFLMISATAPMLQAWFADTGHRSAKDPYFLYAASNLGSMFGLAAYPLLIEPRLTLSEQSWWWTGGYGLLMALVTGCAMVLWRSRRAGHAAIPAAENVQLIKPRFEDEPETGEPCTMPATQEALSEAPITPLRRLRWLALAAVPSSLLLGVTTHISTDIASVPLLWAIPLALYLLSFVLVFAKHQFLPRRGMAALQAILLVIVAGTFYLSGNDSSEIAAIALLHMLAFFATAMVCHGELAADRPASRYLTEFYLWMSLGGVLGGLFNALLAPLLFKSVLEYPLMLVAACLCRARVKDGRGSLSLPLGALASLFGLAVVNQACESLWYSRGETWTTLWKQAEGGAISRFLHFWPELRPLHRFELLALAALVATVLGLIVLTVAVAVNAWLRRGARADSPADGAESDRADYRRNFDRLRSAILARVAVLVPPAWQTRLKAAGDGRGFNAYDLVLGAIMIAVLAAALYVIPHRGMYSRAFATGLVGLGMVAAVGFARRPRRFALTVAMLLGVSWVCAREEAPLFRARSFFGVLRVELEKESDVDGEYEAHQLLHGSTLHGTQGLAAEDALDPWTYYHRTGPVGELFRELEGRRSFLKSGRIGVVGLGTGSIAAYGQPGQRITYFEIDPAVKEIAENPRLFTYLSDCRANYEIVLGDARLRLEDVADNEFDVLLVDAFSSDAIPMHLLTREALRLYVQKLARRGLLAVHISNRHLNLEPVLLNLAADAHLVAGICSDTDENYRGKCSSHWVLLARGVEDFGELDRFEVLQVDPRACGVVPSGLLTREGIQPCFKKVAEEGVLVIHSSDPDPDLEAAVDRLAAAGDFAVGIARVENAGAATGVDVAKSSTWVLVAEMEEHFERLEAMFVAAGSTTSRGGADDAANTVLLELRGDQRVWTDDFSNIVSVIDRDMSWNWLPGWKLWQRLKKWRQP